MPAGNTMKKLDILKHILNFHKNGFGVGLLFLIVITYINFMFILFSLIRS